MSNTTSTERQQQLLATADRVLLANYRQQPVVMSRGQGVELWDVAGRRYLDMTAGISVCCLGHAHPDLAEAVARRLAAIESSET